MPRIKSPKQITRVQTTYASRFGVIAYELIRSNARRTLSISIEEDGRVRVYMPWSYPQEKIERFIEEKAGWITRGVKKAQEHQAIMDTKQYAHGHEFLFLGKKYALAIEENGVKRAGLTFDGSRWVAKLPSGLEGQERERAIKTKIHQWYRQQAEEILGGRIFHYARVMGVEPQKIAIRSQKRIWGNCDYRRQAINLNWQIILSPLPVIDYVVVHELSHLVHPNHSKRFWKKVASVLPGYRQQIQWLKSNHFDMVLP